MKINLETVEFDGSQRLTEYTEKKVNGLTKYFDRIITADVTLKETSDSRNKSEAEIRLKVPGDTLFASSRADSYEKAITETVGALERQIKKYKEKLTTF